jgi:hypothetical protein
MMPAFVRGRRGALRAAAAVVLGMLAPTLAAQDARGVEAQAAARQWLALTDRGDASASWEAADGKFKAAMAVDRWTAALQQVRAPLGALVQRTVVSTRFAKALPGFPAGDYAIVVFRSSFARKTTAQETVTLDRDKGGSWRVVGYSIS